MRLQLYLDQEDATTGALCVSHSEPGQKFLHPELSAFLNNRCAQLIRIQSAVFFPTKFLKAQADFDDVDKSIDREAWDYDRVHARDLWGVEQEL
jgi:hypothetical protein